MEFLLYFLSLLFDDLKKPFLKTYAPKFMILNLNFALKLSNYVVNAVLLKLRPELYQSGNNLSAIKVKQDTIHRATSQ